MHKLERTLKKISTPLGKGLAHNGRARFETPKKSRTKLPVYGL